jgi:hypothetical protein
VALEGRNRPKNGKENFSICEIKLNFVNLFVLKGLSYEIDFENVDENWQILALIRVAAGF